MPDSQNSVHLEGGRQTRQWLQAIERQGRTLSEPMQAIGLILERSVRRNFEAGGRYGSPGSIIGGPNKWAPILRRESIVGAGRSSIQRGKLEGGGILMRSGMSGGLMGSVTSSSSSTAAWASTNKAYGAIQNFGGTTRAHEIKARNAKALRFLSGMQTVFARSVHHPGSKIPARPYMVIQPDDLKTAKKIMLDYLTRRPQQ